MKKTLYKNPSLWISALGLLTVSAFFVQWWTTSNYTTPPRVSAILCAALFIAVCLRFVPQWMKFWTRSEPARTISRSGTPRFMDLKIFSALLGLNLSILLAVFLIRKYLGHQETFAQSLEFWRCLDSNSYLQVSKEWYASEGDRCVQLVFLPGYPALVHLFTYLFGYELYAGFAVSFLAFSGAGCLFYRLMRLDHSHASAVRALKYLCILPGTFFYTAPMTESLFLLLCVGCVYFVRTGKWTLGCALGCYAAFTRSLGVTLLAPLVIELVHEMTASPDRRRRLLKKSAALLLIPLGLAAYLAVNYAVSGDPFKFQEYQSSHWGQHLGWFFNTAAYQLRQLISTYNDNFNVCLGLWAPNLLSVFGSLILILLTAKKLRPSYTAWFIAYFFIAIGVTWLLSAPRYLLTCFPLTIALTTLTNKDENDQLLSTCLIAANLFYLYAYVARWQVW